jgi:hypothetical protein
MLTIYRVTARSFNQAPPQCEKNFDYPSCKNHNLYHVSYNVKFLYNVKLLKIADYY